MKHKHSEVIKAWVDGIECEYYDYTTHHWEKINYLNDFDHFDKVRIKPKEIVKCAVDGCENNKHQGKFKDEFCMPCFEYLLKGIGTHSQAYRNEQANNKYLYVYNSLSRRESWLSERELNMSATYGWQYMGRVEVTK